MSLRNTVVLLIGLLLHLSVSIDGAMLCFYDSASFWREGSAQFTLRELEPALNFCNYLIYGYAGIDIDRYTLRPLNDGLSDKHYRDVIALKMKFPKVRFLLSVGGGRDITISPEGIVDSTTKYQSVLESPERQEAFRASVLKVLNTYGFDGIDLAWQFPQNPPSVKRNSFKKAWNAVKNLFGYRNSIDPEAETHKNQFTGLLRDLSVELKPIGKTLTLTMLPHVDPNLFIDIPNVMQLVDFVNLATYDFVTPTRNPKIADLSTPLYAMYERPPDHNVAYQVDLWLNQTTAVHKLNVGITSYGRAWTMSSKSGLTGYPPVPETHGAAPPGKYTQTIGLLAWPEICDMMHGNKKMTAENATLHPVGDPTKRFGIYAYRSADENGEHGLWVTYENPATATIKADYVRQKGLGGVALFDLSTDDFRGECAGEKFPILRSLNFVL